MTGAKYLRFNKSSTKYLTVQVGTSQAQYKLATNANSSTNAGDTKKTMATIVSTGVVCLWLVTVAVGGVHGYR
jgi:hypothetical protein